MLLRHGSGRCFSLFWRKSACCPRDSTEAFMSRRKGFTLVELLVVVAIIALLISILMPALGAARESARRTQCASNLHTLAIGVMLYAQANHNSFPGIATSPQQPTDWIYFSPWEGEPYGTFANGRIYPYIKDEATYRCPSDDVQQRFNIGTFTGNTHGPYKYSYMINSLSATIARYSCCVISDQARFNGVKRASEKILFLEGNPQTMIDGCWVPPPNTGSIRNDLGDHHDRQASGMEGTGRANVVFLDGHVEFDGPDYIHDPAHWQPVP
jgi:prepilin-type N-terminal cleavage/methylation domain-containing protein/prepilin-type processing-associated H-X9-DG protein